MKYETVPVVLHYLFLITEILVSLYKILEKVGALYVYFMSTNEFATLNLTFSRLSLAAQRRQEEFVKIQISSANCKSASFRT